MKKVVLGMSGGVDSSVCAYLLKQQGYEVIGVFMRNWDSYLNNEIDQKVNNEERMCSQEEDFEFAQKVANQLGIKLHRVDFIKEYWEKVFQQFLHELKHSLTPNPDVLCNKYIKFGAFIEYAKANFANDYIAMGHYAKTITKDGKTHLMIPKDLNKDQTYFLSYLEEQQIAKCIFPLADLTKDEVRKIAKEQNLASALKKDSTGICFIGEKQMTTFLKNYLPETNGKIIDQATGKHVGTHHGLWFYTIGQRKGLNLGGFKESYYVSDKDSIKNILYVANVSNASFLNTKKLLVSELHWINKPDYKTSIKLQAKFRYRQPLQNIELTELNGGIYEINAETELSAITPGQYAVFYLNDECLGCAKIIQAKS